MMARKDERYDPAVNYDSGSDDEDFEPNNVNLSSSPPSYGNNRISDVFIHNNLRSGGPMMNGDRKTKLQEEGDGNEVGEGTDEEEDKQKGPEVSLEKFPECWDPEETEHEKERAREMCKRDGPKTCGNDTPGPLGGHRCPYYPSRNFVGFLYNHAHFGCKVKEPMPYASMLCYKCATKTRCPLHTEPQQWPLEEYPPKKMD